MAETKNSDAAVAGHHADLRAHTSHCQLSSPVLNVNDTGEHATILGHDARKQRGVVADLQDTTAAT